MERLTISGGEITFYEPIYAKCSNKNAPKIQKQIDKNIPFYDMVGYKYEDMTIRKVEDIYNKLAKLEDLLEKYDIESAEDLDKFIHHKDCQIKKWKQDYENCSKLEKSISKEYQYCLDNWRACENELAELKQKAIVPKFKVGQEVYIINKEYYYKKHWCVEKHKIVGIEDKIDRNEKYVRWYTLTYGDIKLGNRYKFQEKDVFATKEEAEQKLAKIGGEDE